MLGSGNIRCWLAHTGFLLKDKRASLWNPCKHITSWFDWIDGKGILASDKVQNFVLGSVASQPKKQCLSLIFRPGAFLCAVNMFPLFLSGLLQASTCYQLPNPHVVRMRNLLRSHKKQGSNQAVCLSIQPRGKLVIYPERNPTFPRKTQRGSHGKTTRI